MSVHWLPDVSHGKKSGQDNLGNEMGSCDSSTEPFGHHGKLATALFADLGFLSPGLR